MTFELGKDEASGKFAPADAIPRIRNDVDAVVTNVEEAVQAPWRAVTGAPSAGHANLQGLEMSAAGRNANPRFCESPHPAAARYGRGPLLASVLDVMLHRRGLPLRPRSQLRVTGLGLCAGAILTVACNGTTTDEAASGGAPPASGGAATGGAATGGAATGGATTGGAPATGGGGTDVGGGGSAGAPALAACGCPEDSSVTIQLESGTSVFDRAAGAGDSCNLAACEAEVAHANWSGAPPSYYRIRACQESGDCVEIRTGFVQFPTDQGDVTLVEGGEVTLDGEPVTIEAALVENDTMLEFSFETDAEMTDAVVSGSGRVCFVETDYICLK